MPAIDILTTRVGIVGGGPAGLMLSHLLGTAGIDSIVVENRDHETIRTTHRAGILEHGSVSMLVDSGVSDRVLTAGYKHEGIDLRFGGESHRIDFTELVGEAVWLYPQNEVFVDLAAARGARRRADVLVGHRHRGADQTTDTPKIRFTDAGGHAREIHCDDPGRRRRVARHLQAVDPAGTPDGQLRGVPVRLVRHPLRGAAERGGADLLQLRARLRADQPA